MRPKDINNANKGVVLMMVLATVLVVVALANIVLMFITSQARLTQHQIGRIQAHYAAQAGMNYAVDMLRRELWVPGITPAQTMCRSTSVPACTIVEDSLPPPPFRVTITISPAGTDPNFPDCAPITTAVTYTTPQ